MENIRFYNYRNLVKPGITGWAQVTYPEGLTIDTTQEKLKYDLYYIKNIGFMLDLAILLKTVRTVIFGKGR
jgi:lipopolysaccharide/colanic/teichoic acid biosynthesis glycosyltransferase